MLKFSLIFILIVIVQITQTFSYKTSKYLSSGPCLVKTETKGLKYYILSYKPSVIVIYSLKFQIELIQDHTNTLKHLNCPQVKLNIQLKRNLVYTTPSDT